jgi:hypothetical protein
VDKFSWIKDLVTADQQMRDGGIVDLSEDSMKLEDASIDFLHDLKLEFLKVTSAFNQLSGSEIGPVKVYAIARTRADFMLFRNGVKLIFSLENGGGISVSYLSGLTGDERTSQHSLTPELINFGQLRWMYKGHVFEKDHLVRFYMTQFVRASAEVKRGTPLSGDANEQ